MTEKRTAFAAMKLLQVDVHSHSCNPAVEAKLPDGCIGVLLVFDSMDALRSVMGEGVEATMVQIGKVATNGLR